MSGIAPFRGFVANIQFPRAITDCPFGAAMCRTIVRRNSVAHEVRRLSSAFNRPATQVGDDFTRRQGLRVWKKCAAVQDLMNPSDWRRDVIEIAIETAATRRTPDSIIRHESRHTDWPDVSGQAMWCEMDSQAVSSIHTLIIPIRFSCFASKTTYKSIRGDHGNGPDRKHPIHDITTDEMRQLPAIDQQFREYDAIQRGGYWRVDLHT